MSDVIVIHEDIAALRFCNKGARSFFARHELDWALFMQQGIAASVLQEIGDAMGLAAIEQAKKRLRVTT